MKWLTWLAAGILATSSAVAQAQGTGDFPNHPIRIIVPFPAGGTADILPRIVAEKLHQRFKQPVLIENRSGAGGNVGAEVVANATPDGYTLFASAPGPIAINQTLYKKLSYDPNKFEPITVLGAVPNALVVRTGFPAKTAQEAIAYIKANPGKVNFASQGNGSTSHLTAVMFQMATGTEMLHVPYRGSAPAQADIVANHVDLIFDNLGFTIPLHKGGKARILAIASLKRAPALPDVPTLDEVGLKGFEAIAWFAVVAPPGTPKPIVELLNKAFTDALKMPDVIKQYETRSVQPVGGTTAETAAYFNAERKRWGDVIRAAHISIE